MRVAIRHSCENFASYRAARVKSLFNAESGCRFDRDYDLPLDDRPWKVGLVVGPSGSGKTSIGRALWEGAAFYEQGAGWPTGAPIVDAIAPDGDFNAVTGALAAVGLGDVPAWLRPYHVLSNGERFRADLARIVSDAPPRVVVDEFTSVVDRQIAKVGALAFAKAWRRTTGQAVLLSCHYDIIPWLQPDWTFDTKDGTFTWGCLQRRPPIEVDVHRVDWSWWPLFEPHHYLKMPKMVAAHCYIVAVAGDPVAHLAVSSLHTGLGVEARACRMVVLPEWQGAGIGLRFLNQVCEWQRIGDVRARLPGRSLATLFHTSHPGLVSALRRDARWRQVSASLYGSNKRRSRASIARSGSVVGGGYGGHFRAVQGFRYVGAEQGRAARA